MCTLEFRQFVDSSFMKIFRSLFFLKPYFFAILIFPMFAIASPNAITFQSKIIKPNGAALEAAAVSFRLSLTDALGTCVIFQEDFSNQNMTASKGLINLSLGGGVQVFPVAPMTLVEAFNNYNSPTISCQAGGTVSPGSTDRRKLVVQFNDGSGWQTVPAMDINSNPFALQAVSSQRLGDYPAADYLRTAVMPTCGGGEALHFNGTSFTCVLMGGGSGTVTSVTSANSDIGVATTTTTPVLTLNAGIGANQIVKLNGTSQLPAVSGANLTNLNASNLASGTVPAAQMPALTGDVTMTAGNTATAIAAGAIVDADINGSAGIARSKLAAGTVGQVVMNDATTGLPISIGCANNEVIKFNGSGVAVCGTDNTGAGDVLQNGNSFAGAMTIGTNDNNDLNFETNGTTKMTVLANGNVGVGNASPGAKLDITAAGGPQARFSYDASKYFTVSVDGSAGDTDVTLDATSSGLERVFFNDQTTFTNNNGLYQYAAGMARQVDTTSAIGTLSGMEVSFYRNAASNGSTDTVRGALIDIIRSGASTSSSRNATGIEVSVGNTGASSGTVTTRGQWISVGGDTGGASTAYGSQISASGADNVYGQYTSVVSATGGTATGLYVDAGTGPGTEYAAALMNGNVGIGTTSPQRLLHTAGPIRIAPTTVPASPAAGDIYVDSADSNKLKVYDGSGWVASGGGGSGTVTSVTSANADIGIATTTTTPVLTLNVGTGNNQIVKLNASAELPAVSGVNLTAISASNLGSGTLPAARFPAFTGDVTTSAGAVATTIAANAVTSAKINDGEIVNVDINAAAAIARTKIASGSNNHVLINDGSGVMTSEAQLSVSRGGTGLSSYTNNALIMANGTGSALTSSTCSLGEVLLWSGTAWACTNLAGSSQGYIKDGGNTFTGTATIGTNSNHNLEIETNSVSRIFIDNSGNVGIGAASSGNKLEIAGNIRQTSGQITSAPYNNVAAIAFDFNNGNVQYTSANCQAMTLTNLQDGGSYTIAVKGTTSGTCSFSQAGLTFWYSPAQGPTANGSQSTYTFLRMGNDVYVTWISLYQ
jgi:trimeric autotransporter adhesin